MKNVGPKEQEISLGKQAGSGYTGFALLCYRWPFKVYQQVNDRMRLVLCTDYFHRCKCEALESWYVRGCRRQREEDRVIIPVR